MNSIQFNSIQFNSIQFNLFKFKSNSQMIVNLSTNMNKTYEKGSQNNNFLNS
jgi:hypothetical protein